MNAKETEKDAEQKLLEYNLGELKLILNFVAFFKLFQFRTKFCVNKCALFVDTQIEYRALLFVSLTASLQNKLN